MARFNFLLITILLSSSGLMAQNCVIETTNEVVNTARGKNTGSITITISDDSKDIKLFLLNQGEERAKEEIKTRKIEKLKAGRYEFIVIDTKKDQCYKYLSIEVVDTQ
jgi:hypothetical protein